MTQPELRVPPAGDVPELLGLIEIAVYFGVSRHTPNVWRARAHQARLTAQPGADLDHLFPEEDVLAGEIGSDVRSRTPLWRRDRLDIWGAKTGRQRHHAELDRLRATKRAERERADKKARKTAASGADKRREQDRTRKARARATARADNR